MYHQSSVNTYLMGKFYVLLNGKVLRLTKIDYFDCQQNFYSNIILCFSTPILVNAFFTQVSLPKEGLNYKHFIYSMKKINVDLYIFWCVKPF